MVTKPITTKDKALTKAAAEAGIQRGHNREQDEVLDGFFSSFLHSALQRMISLVPNASLRELAVAVGIIHDKRGQLRGVNPAPLAPASWDSTVGEITRQVAVFQERITIRQKEQGESMPAIDVKAEED